MDPKAFLVVIACLTSTLHGENLGAYASDQASSLRSPRAEAMAGSGLALADGDWGGLNNPAGIASGGVGLAVRQQNLPLGFQRQAVTGSTTLAWLGLSAQLVNVNWGEFEALDAQGNLTGHFRSGLMGVALGAAGSFLPGLRAGTVLRATQMSIASYSAQGLSGDFGIRYQHQAWSLGAVIRNVGRDDSGPVWSSAGLGAAWNQGPWAAATDFVALPGDSFSVSAGIERRLLENISMRAGFSREDAGLQAAWRVSAGAGLVLNAMTLDASARFMDPLGTSIDIGLSWRYGRGA